MSDLAESIALAGQVRTIFRVWRWCWFCMTKADWMKSMGTLANRHRKLHISIPTPVKYMDHSHREDGVEQRQVKDQQRKPTGIRTRPEGNSA